MALYANTNVQIREIADFAIGTPPQSIASETVETSAWVNIHEWRRGVGMALVRCASDGTTLHVYWRQATDADGSDAKDLGDEVTLEADGEQSLMCIAEARETEVDTDGGFGYVALAFYHDEGQALDGASVVGGMPYMRDENVKTTDSLDCTTTTTT
jgi:hypothetical protein